MAEITLKGRKIPLLYTVFEMKAIQEEVGPLGDLQYTLFGKNRDEVCKELRVNGIYSRKYFYPALNEIESYMDCPGGSTPVTYDVSRNILTLPIYEDLPVETVDRICDIICG